MLEEVETITRGDSAYALRQVPALNFDLKTISDFVPAAGEFFSVSTPRSPAIVF